MTVLSSGPAGVDEPGGAVELLHLGSEHFGVDGGVEGQECGSEAGGEGGYGIDDSDLGTGDLGGVPSDEVVHGLLGGQLGDGRQHSEGVAGEEDDVLGVASDRRELGSRDELQRVGGSGVLGQRDVVVVDNSVVVVVEEDVLKD